MRNVLLLSSLCHELASTTFSESRDEFNAQCSASRPPGPHKSVVLLAPSNNAVGTQHRCFILTRQFIQSVRPKDLIIQQEQRNSGLVREQAFLVYHAANNNDEIHIV